MKKSDLLFYLKRCIKKRLNLRVFQRVVKYSSVIVCLLVSTSANAWSLTEDISVHGFITQSFFHSSDNNFYGHSDDGVSPGLTEIGLNISYQMTNDLSVLAQGLYRRAGDLDAGSVRLDFALLDYNLFNYDKGQVGLRAGRIKYTYGLYNDTRDITFVNPSIFLPQGMYFDRSRDLLISADGFSLYADHTSQIGDFHLKFNFGLPPGDSDEIRAAVLGTGARGKMTAAPSTAMQLLYEINGGEYILGVSHNLLRLEYEPIANDIFSAGSTDIHALAFSGQYNGESFTLTGEFSHRWNIFEGYGSVPDITTQTQTWYVQGSYKVIPELDLVLRYEDVVMSIDDKDGSMFAALGLPSHLGYANDFMVGIRWDINPSWMLRAEYHRVNGTAWLTVADNPNQTSLVGNWDLYALQLSYHF